MVTFGINPLLKTAGHGKFPPAILLMRFPLRGYLRDAHSSAPPQTATSILLTCPCASGQALILDRTARRRGTPALSLLFRSQGHALSARIFNRRAGGQTG